MLASEAKIKKGDANHQALFFVQKYDTDNASTKVSHFGNIEVFLSLH